MTDYPATPSFGYDRGRPNTMPTYNGAVEPPYRNYGDGHQEPAQALTYNQAQSMAAFMQNGGFPGLSAAAVAPGVPPLPVYRNWDGPSYAPPLDTTQQNVPYSSIAQKAQILPMNRNSGSHETAQNISIVPNSADAQQIIEEGELSEGEYEDNVPAWSQNKPDRSAINGDRERLDEYEPSHQMYGQSRAENARRQDEETVIRENQTDMYGRSLDLSRQRSDSYSPRLSPALAVRAPAQVRIQSLPDYGNDGSVETVSVADVGAQSVNKSELISTAYTEQDLREARKEAQSAVLNLWPFKVRLEHYIDEGIDERVIRQQFQELGMLPTTPNERQATDLAESNAPERVDSAQFNTLSLPKTTNIAPAKEDKVEERKDRIARLLAEKSKKNNNSAGQQGTSANNISPQTSAPNSTKADKERLLRQKMEALQKSREARAMKAAVKPSSPSAPAASSTSQSQISLSAPRKESPAVDIASPSIGKSETLINQISPSTTPSQLLSSQQNPTSIPGLFLSRSSSDTPSSTTSKLPAPANNVTQRKRPVASDFDTPATPGGSYKRPFGQNRNDQRLVIDVSEEESDDEDMSVTEVDHQLANFTGHLTPNGQGLPKTLPMRDQPPLSDPHTRKAPAPALVSITPPSSQAINKNVGKPENLQRKELEIQELRRKIALVELRKKAKKDLNKSQPLSVTKDTSGISTPVNEVSISNKIEASVQIEQLLQSASQQVDQDQRKIAETQAVVMEQSAELKVNNIEHKRLRRARIVADLPMLDAEVEASQKKLAELKSEMAKLEAAVEQGLENKRRLAEEMEKLGLEAEEQLQEQKDKLRDLVQNETDNTTKANDQPVEEQLLPLATEPADVEMEVSDGAISETYQPLTEDNSTNTTASKELDSIRVENTTNSVDDNSLVAVSQPSTSTDVNKHDSTEGETESAQSLDAALQSAIATAENESMASAGSDIEMEDSYAPDPNELAPASATSPDESNATNSLHPSGNDRSDWIISDRSDAESEQYEPPEATPAASDDDIPMSMDESPPFSPAPPEITDVTAKMTDSAVDGPARPASLSSNQTREVKRRPFLKDTFLGPKQGPVNQHILGLVPNEKSTSFTPYESPLNRFRDFRFHPSFVKEVPGGFKSLTYSNNIKANEELCRYELAGGICNDNTCDLQHFRTMGLADDAILVELGNSAGYSEADKPKFISGLRNVLQDLRLKKTKDFKVIAAEIAAYRTRFLNDSSRVLSLGDTTI